MQWEGHGTTKHEPDKSHQHCYACTQRILPLLRPKIQTLEHKNRAVISLPLLVLWSSWFPLTLKANARNRHAPHGCISILFLLFTCNHSSCIAFSNRLNKNARNQTKCLIPNVRLMLVFTSETGRCSYPVFHSWMKSDMFWFCDKFSCISLSCNLG